MEPRTAPRARSGSCRRPRARKPGFPRGSGADIAASMVRISSERPISGHVNRTSESLEGRSRTRPNAENARIRAVPSRFTPDGSAGGRSRSRSAGRKIATTPSTSIGSDNARNVACSPAASASGPGHDQPERPCGVGQRPHHPDHAAAQMLRRAGLHDVVVDRRDRPVDESDDGAQHQDHRQRRQERDDRHRDARASAPRSASRPACSSTSTAPHSPAPPPGRRRSTPSAPSPAGPVRCGR